MSNTPESEKGVSFMAILEWFAFCRQVKYHNRSNLDPSSKVLFETTLNWLEEHCCVSLSEGAAFFRGRIHDPVDDREPPTVLGSPQPLPVDQIGAPPASKCNSGRLNPEGIPYLYLADSEETVVAELRAWRAAHITIGEFRTVRELRVIGLHSSHVTGCKNDEIKAWLQFIGLAFSAPHHPNDPMASTPTQFLAEGLKARGFDGVQYGSAADGGGLNTALFDTSAAKSSSRWLIGVSEVAYTFDRIGRG